MVSCSNTLCDHNLLFEIVQKHSKSYVEALVVVIWKETEAGACVTVAFYINLCFECIFWITDHMHS